MKITEVIKKKRLISDGGFGTMLQAAGMTLGETSEEWNLSHKDIIVDIHKQYINAGADIITANTSIRGARTATRVIIWKAFCTWLTSVVRRVTILAGENLSIFEKE